MTSTNGDVAHSDIAIIGMALRVPGATSVDEFWLNLRNGVESIRTLTPEELIAAGEKPDRIRRKNYVPRTADLAGMELFDADFFGLGPKDAAIMDPQHRQLLECAWEAFEDAARPPEAFPGPVGVFAGCGMGSYFYFNVCSHRDLVDKVGMFLLRHTGNDKDFLATRVSHLFNLRGPSVNIQTACSTSLVAVHYACMSLLNGECDAAIAGGSTIELPHRRGYLFQEGEILSPDGHCRAFDHRAQGTVFGSGTGVVVLRRLADALADGDPIRAVIKATAVNNDGASKAGYLAPSVSGQAEAVVEAIGLAGLGGEDIQYIECHGTGTYLGDPIEIEALTEAYRTTTQKVGFCRVGSVKTNIGHLDTAAGVVGLIKTILALQHREIPPTLGFEKPNPAINFAASPFVVADRLQPWPKTAGPRRAAVNSLGVGGTNAHAIIEEAPAAPAAGPANDEPRVLVLSAKSRKGLDAAGRRLAAHLVAHPEMSIADVAHTLFAGRTHFEHRRVLAVSGRDDAIAMLAAGETSRAATASLLPNVSGAVFLFPGGGAQYPGMTRDLYRRNPVFRKTVDEGLSYLPAETSAEIRRLWIDAGPDDTEAASRFLKPSLQLPAILIVEVALFRLWTEYGVRPAALIGHSMGENAAACCAGVLSFRHAVELVRLRGELFDEIKGGGMLSVGLGEAELSARLPASLDMASVNAPTLCVVSGTNEDLQAFEKDLVTAGIDATRIAIDIAAHSRALAPILGRFEAFLKSIPLSPPSIRIVSNRSGRWLSNQEATDPAYWASHLRSTVRFADGLATLAEDPDRIYIEVGPGRALSSLVKAQGRVAAPRVINSLPHPDERTDDSLHWLTAVARAWATGLKADTGRLFPAASARRIALPTYAFQGQRYFLDHIEPKPEQDEPRFQKAADMASWGWRPAWRQSSPPTRLNADREPANWLVLEDEAGLGPELVSRLRARGHHVVRVAMGDAYAKQDDMSFVVCPELGRDGYDALIKDLEQQGKLPDRIVHLGLLTTDERHRPGSSFFDRIQERGFQSLLCLAQALGEAGSGAPVQTTVITNGMLRVGDEALQYPAKAIVLGPAQVIPREMPNHHVRVIDVPVERPRKATAMLTEALGISGSQLGLSEADRIVRTIWDDLFADHGCEIVAYRQGRRWHQFHEPCPLPVIAQSEPFRKSGVYLITGGLGDLGLLFARELARHVQARLVLVGRTPLPPRSEWDRYAAAYGSFDKIGRAIAAIREIEQLGGQVHVASADVTDPDAMAKVVAGARAAFGPINGVLHTAGVVLDGLIALKTQSESQEVLAPKVVGTIVLADVLKDEPLDLVVLFSSTSTDIAPAGQVDYVAANAYLNAFADSRWGSPGPCVVAVHWGIWKDIGLAARAVSTADHGVGTAGVQTARTPLFDRKWGDVSGELRLDARWDSETSWVLNEHRLASGLAVWPGTGYLEALAEAVAEAGLEGAFELEDLLFHRPLGVPGKEARSVRATLRADGATLRFALESEMSLPGGVGLITHADAVVKRVQSARPAPVDIAALKQRIASRIEGGTDTPMRSAQEKHLRFGPRWAVLRTAHYGNGEALGLLALHDAYISDLASGYRLHPALLDIATGFAMDLVPGYSADAGLWVPISYGRVVVHRNLPAKIYSHVRRDPNQQPGAGFAAFDITLMDESGSVVVEIERFTIKQMAAGFDVERAIADTSGAKVQEAHTGTGDTDKSPGLRRLEAQMEQGIAAGEGFEALCRALAVGAPQIIVSSMDLPVLQKAAGAVDEVHSAETGFDRPDLDAEFVAPRNAVEQTLAQFWSELLGVQKVGIHDSFFDLGGHSLIAVRLFRMIKKEFATDLPISVLFQAPTIAQCAELIEQAAGPAPDRASASITTEDKPGLGQSATAAPHRLVHIVPMHPGRNALNTPLFICAGMFGNVLNLRHLAEQIGRDRPVYGLQARGLFGDQTPHETFEEMARDYLKEVRLVQPGGPYLLSGFSGGGLVAHEMARQLVEAGEDVDLVVLLDTPYPEEVNLSSADRIAMKLQDIRREGPRYAIDWTRDKIAWQKRKRQSAAGLPERGNEEFHNEEIEAAFRRALGRYKAPSSQWPVVLLRPRLNVRYRLSGGRELNVDRSPLHDDNGWRPFVEDLTIIEVPGDHDSMVLEPNVRVLAGHLGRALRMRSARNPLQDLKAAE